MRAEDFFAFTADGLMSCHNRCHLFHSVGRSGTFRAKGPIYERYRQHRQALLLTFVEKQSCSRKSHRTNYVVSLHVAIMKITLESTSGSENVLGSFRNYQYK